MKRWSAAGPGIIIAAAFIGPGTVTTATLAGARHGTTLLWALVFATVATIVLQEMSARLGLATGKGLGSALRDIHRQRWIGAGLAILAAIAVVGGAAAYEAGNLTGAGLGLESITGLPLRIWIGLGTVFAALLLMTGSYRIVERVLAGCVAIMGLVFVVTAILVAPALSELAAGAFVPRLPDGGELTAIALIGTTIVPYNLFLHAAVVSERFAGIGELRAARRDLVVAIGLGGIVSAAVVVTASAAIAGGEVSSASDMALQLEPLLGAWAGHAFALGYAAAGISSAVTAPLAATYVVLDMLSHDRDTRSLPARTVWAGCLLVGAGAALLGTKPVALIYVAQIVNGMILPIVAIVLLTAVNDRSRLGEHVNGWRGNAAGIIVVLLCAALGVRSILKALGI